MIDDVQPEPSHQAFEEDLPPRSPEAVSAWEDELRGRLGLLPLGYVQPRQLVIQGWIATVIATLVAFLTRFINLAHPGRLIFDETYYVKGAFSLLRLGFEGNWEGENVNDQFIAGNFSALSTSDPDYVVHPPFGKWLMAVGQALFGSDNGVGWRFTTAVVGVLSVAILVRIALRLFRSPWLAGFAGLAMALDGMGITLSRIGILDNILAFFILLGFYTLLRDREHSRAILAHRVATASIDHRGIHPQISGPRAIFRPWLVATGLILGLSCGVKWSGIYAVAVFGIAAYAWSMSARRAVGIRRFFAGATIDDGIPAFLALVPTALVTYLATWLSWFLNPHGYFRHWAEEAVANGENLPLPWAPDALNSLWHYHESMWTFHTGLSTPHQYQSQAWQWLFQFRPVSLYWEGETEMAAQCPHSSCVQAITSIGNPFIWWFAVVALVIVIWWAFRGRDWRAWAIIIGYGATWMPWLQYTNRTIFQFYAVVMLPFVVLALTFGVAVLANALGPATAPRRSFEDVVYPTKDETDSAAAEGVEFVAATAATTDLELPRITGEPSPATDNDGPAQESYGLSEEAPNPGTLVASDPVDEWANLIHGKPVKARQWWLPLPWTKPGITTVAVIAGVILIASAFWMPLWWGTTVSRTFWQIHMWMPLWV